MTHWISRFVAAVVVRTLARTAPVLAAAVLVAAPVATQAAGGGYPLASASTRSSGRWSLISA